MKTKVRLPVLVEHSIGRVETTRQDLAQQFEAALLSEAKTAGASIACTPGCASCCYHPIYVSILEAIPIYRHLVRHQKWTTALKERLEDIGNKQMITAYEVWLLSLIPCPLLSEDKRCIAYDARPLACRTMFSVGDPYYCHPHNLGPETEVIPQGTVLEKFSKEERKALQKHKIQVSRIPLGKALLLAERVCQGDLDITEIDAEILKELSNG